jgi:hypothetical protein
MRPAQSAPCGVAAEIVFDAVVLAADGAVYYAVIAARQSLTANSVRSRTFGPHHAPTFIMSSPQRIRASEHRTYFDSSGIPWTVEEKRRQDPFLGDDGLALIFESSAAFRCVCNYPDNWFNLNDADLERLSWRK